MKTLPPTESTLEAADRIGCSPPSVRAMIREGLIGGVRIGRNIRVLSASVTRYISVLAWNQYVDGLLWPEDPEAFEAEMLEAGVIDSEILENLKKLEKLKKPARREK